MGHGTWKNYGQWPWNVVQNFRVTSLSTLMTTHSRKCPWDLKNPEISSSTEAMNLAFFNFFFFACSKEYVENMKKYMENIKEYAGIRGKYEGNMMKYEVIRDHMLPIHGL